ncbi:MAG TPA: chromate efflux transporter [bacterium]|nr:chromate efflux transporter [bacterium]
MPSNSPRPDFPPSVARLLLSFLRLGATAFGGPSMVAYIRRLAVQKRHWLDAATFDDGVALCQMIPGATAMQTTAYVGLRTRGVLGAAASFIGFGLPAFILMTTFAALYARAHALPIVVSAFSGLQAMIVAIMANATLSFGRTTLKSWRPAVIAGLAAAMFGLRVNPIIVIVLAGALGFALNRPAQKDGAVSTSARTPTHLKPVLLTLACAAIGLGALFWFRRPLFVLAALMSKIDLFAFGGGFASVPLMFHEVVDVRKWMDGQTFMNGIVLGQVTPGPIVITATFVGYLLGGPLGGVVATIGILLPSFLMVVAVAPYFDRLRASPGFNRVISGVLASFVGLLLTVTIRFATNVHWDWAHLVLAASAFLALVLSVDLLWVVLAGIAASIAIFTWLPH